MHATKILLTRTLLGLSLILAPNTASWAQTDTPAQPATSASAIDFGNDSSHWSLDQECDDPRFEGSAMAVQLEDIDIGKDASDCKAAFDAGDISLRANADSAVSTATDAPEPPPQRPVEAAETIAAAIDYGDDLGQYPNDGDCDDPRFEGVGAIESAEEIDILHDASDCKAAVAAGTAQLKPSAIPPVPFVQPKIEAIAFGDDAEPFSADGLCSDPRFIGAAMADSTPVDAVMHDASDCRAAFAANTILVNDTTPIPGFNLGQDTSKYANDGQCDDPRFEGAGMAKKLLPADRLADQSDCQALMRSGTIWPRPIYQNTYRANAPYDPNSSGIDFGDNTASYANDGECDDPRFEGLGMAESPDYGSQWHDANDCKTAYEQGVIAPLP